MANECRRVCGDDVGRRAPARSAAARSDRPGALPGQPAAARVEEQRRRARARRRPAPGGPARGRRRRASRGVAAHRARPAPCRPCRAAAPSPSSQVEVVDVEADRLGDARAGAVEHLEQRPVAQRQRASSPAPGRLQESLDLVDGRSPWAAAAAAAAGGRRAAGSAVGEPLARGEAVEAAHGDDACAAAEAAASGGCSASPSRSAARKSATSASRRPRRASVDPAAGAGTRR